MWVLGKIKTLGSGFQLNFFISRKLKATVCCPKENLGSDKEEREKQGRVSLILWFETLNDYSSIINGGIYYD